MEICQLYKQLWEIFDTDEENAYPFIKQQQAIFPADVDINYIYLELVRQKETENIFDHYWPMVSQVWNSVIKDRNKHAAIVTAKAYAYLGHFENFEETRLEYLDSATALLGQVEMSDERRFMEQFIDIARIKNRYEGILTEYKCYKNLNPGNA